MAEPVRARRISDEEGRRLLQIVRRGEARVGPGAPGGEGRLVSRSSASRRPSPRYPGNEQCDEYLPPR